MLLVAQTHAHTHAYTRQSLTQPQRCRSAACRAGCARICTPSFHSLTLSRTWHGAEWGVTHTMGLRWVTMTTSGGIALERSRSTRTPWRARSWQRASRMCTHTPTAAAAWWPSSTWPATARSATPATTSSGTCTVTLCTAHSGTHTHTHTCARCSHLHGSLIGVRSYAIFTLEYCRKLMPTHADGVTAVVDLTGFGVRHMDLAVVRVRLCTSPTAQHAHIIAS